MAGARDRSTVADVEVSVDVAARPGTVWRCLTEPPLLAKWLAARVDLEARVGAPLVVHFERHGRRVEGSIVEIVPRRRIVFTWGVAQGAEAATIPPGSSRVTIALDPAPLGTRVTLFHAGLPSEEERANHEGGWRDYARSLAGVAQGVPASGTPESLVDTWFAACAETDAERRSALLAACFDPDGAFRDARADLRGRESVSSWIAQCQSLLPGVRMERDGEVLQARGSLLARWRTVGPDGSPVATGFSRLRLGPLGLARSIEGFGA